MYCQPYLIFSLIFGAYAKQLQKGPMFSTVCPSVRTEKLGSHMTDFREMWYWALLLDFVDKFEIWLKLEKNSRHLHEDLHRFLPVL